MLSCKEATRLASKSLDEALTSSERANYRFHLMMCPGCRHFRQNLRFLQQAGERAGPAPASDDPANAK
ncbi:MAG: zf-HC2 domain-containing protein [Pandoraea sp.]|uniref:zf-HC2 domain-containing protein n=1 Tax=Pandoraea sp. TaxID=1883445 RepID=UPI00120E42D1|nr:zf-HC2 domain-containing protein [Pandoraea sp.]TAM20650.1 MAG: zf-HC2 domain-containing protein [Pandoraea sp.]